MKFKDAKDIYSFWEDKVLFAADPNSKKKSYSLLIPPPNLTGELHLGHAMQHSILDAVARFKRLQGFDVLLLPGVDHAGIQFEATFDKQLSKEKLSKEKLGREKWLEKAWEFKGEVYKSVSSTWRFMGLSADWSREVFTMDEGPRQAVFHQFKTFWEKGLIYRGPYIVQWCPKDQTAIEDVEMEYEERKEKLYYVKYKTFLQAKMQISNFKFPISNKGESSEKYIVVATTRPETIFADSAVAVYPNHPKYKKFVGGKVVNPLTGKEIEVIEEERVEKDFGTGALKITPAHDLMDYEIGRDHGLEMLHAVNKHGRLTDLGGEFSGLKVLEAREKVAEKLRADGLIEKEEDYVHNVAVCERCKSVVEPLISKEWFVKTKELAGGAIDVIKKDRIDFFPKNYKKILVEWLEDIHDWCISRSLWWGHRIPVWYRDADPSTSSGPDGMKVSLESPGPGWKQDEQVLDTWFSSGLWPMSTLGWPTEGQRNRGSKSESNKVNVTASASEAVSSKIASPVTPGNDSNLLQRYFPWDFEISAPEIKYLWIARMIMLSLYFTGEIPFKTMFFHGMLRDLEGRKFSKSLGNGIEPQYLIDNWGVDATRMALYTYAIPGRDGKVSKATLDERSKNFRNFGTKLRNIARYILELKHDQRVTASGSEAVSSEIASSKTPRNDKSAAVRHPELDSGSVISSRQARTIQTSEAHPQGDSGRDDRWIMDELEKTTKRVTKHLDSLELHLAADELYEFVWHKFADRYIESTKDRRGEAQPTLEHVLKHVLILLHPFMPFLTEELYQTFETKRESVMLEDWPG